MKPIIDNATYDGDRWTYGFRNRPPGYAHNPDGFIFGSDGTHVDFPNYGTLDYPRELTDKEASGFELHLTRILLASRSRWDNYYYRAVHRWYTTPIKPKYEAYYMLLTPTDDADDIDMDNLWLAHQIEDERWELRPFATANE